MPSSNNGLTFADYIEMKPSLEYVDRLVDEIRSCKESKKRQRLTFRLCELSQMIADRVICSFELDNTPSYSHPRTDYTFDEQGNIIRA